MPARGRAFTLRAGKDKPGIDDALKPKYKEKKRTCLMCGVVFLSEWSGNRRCRACSHVLHRHTLEGGYLSGSSFEPDAVPTELPSEYMIT